MKMLTEPLNTIYQKEVPMLRSHLSMNMKEQLPISVDSRYLGPRVRDTHYQLKIYASGR